MTHGFRILVLIPSSICPSRILFQRTQNRIIL